MIRWAWCGFHKKRAGRRYGVFLHLMGSTGHVVHSGTSVTRNINTLFVMLGWDRYEFDKKHNRTHYTELMFLHLVGFACHIVNSGMFGP
jgi:hypothetical protein